MISQNKTSNAYIEVMRENNRANTQKLKEEQLNLGVTHYIWSAVCDEITCETCSENNNKTFAWDESPPCGHPGEVTCCKKGYCRCLPLPYLEHILSDGGVKPESRTRRFKKGK